MRLILTGSTDPFYNLAAEEYYLRFCEEDVFMLWQNAPVVVIGKNQNLYAEVKLDYTESHGILVVRRITGGGAVYHDLGNVNYTFITSRDKANVLDFEYFTKPVIEALKGLGIEAELSGRNDLLAKVTDEQGEPFFAKFSGNAMTATKDRILNHGTLLFDSDLSVLEKTLNPDEEKLRKRSIKSVRSRVTNLRPLVRDEEGNPKDLSTEEFFRYLVGYVENTYQCRAEKADPLQVLETGFYDRNRDETYLAGRRVPYEHERRCRFPSGLVVVLWNEENGRMKEVRIEGDFFGDQEIEVLEAKLGKVPATAASVSAALAGTQVTDFITGVTNEQFSSLFDEP